MICYPKCEVTEHNFILLIYFFIPFYLAKVKNTHSVYTFIQSVFRCIQAILFYQYVNQTPDTMSYQLRFCKN